MAVTEPESARQESGTARSDERAAGREETASSPDLGATERAEAAPNDATLPKSEEEPPFEPGSSSGIAYCVRCGGVMRREDLFCHSCGWDVRMPPPPSPTRRVEVNPSDRNRLAALLVCLLLGWAGLHRFYVGKVGSGLVWLLTLGFFGIGVIYDLVLIATGEFRDIEGRRVVRWE